MKKKSLQLACSLALAVSMVTQAIYPSAALIADTIETDPDVEITSESSYETSETSEESYPVDVSEPSASTDYTYVEETADLDETEATDPSSDETDAISSATDPDPTAETTDETVIETEETEETEETIEEEESTVEIIEVSDMDAFLDEVTALPSSYRVIVSTTIDISDSIENVVGAYYDGVYILSFEDEASYSAAISFFSNCGISYCQDGTVEVNGVADYFHPISNAEINANGTVRVAIIDTGSNLANESYSVIGDYTGDDNGHGTRMTQLVLDNDADNAYIISIKALGSDGHGSIVDVYNAVQLALDLGADYILMSFSTLNSTEYTAFKDLLSFANSVGATVVASAGNNGMNAAFYVPACESGVTTVGALNDDFTKQNTSNYGPCVNYYVVADSTSDAAALYVGYSLAGNSGNIYTTYLSESTSLSDSELYALYSDIANEITNELIAEYGYGECRLEINENGEFVFVYVFEGSASSDVVINARPDAELANYATTDIGSSPVAISDGMSGTDSGTATYSQGSYPGWGSISSISSSGTTGSGLMLSQFASTMAVCCSRAFGGENSRYATPLTNGQAVEYSASYIVSGGRITWTVMVGAPGRNLTQPTWEGRSLNTTWRIAVQGGSTGVEYVAYVNGSGAGTVSATEAGAITTITNAVNAAVADIRNSIANDEFGAKRNLRTTGLPTGVGSGTAVSTWEVTVNPQIFEGRLSAGQPDTPHAAIRFNKIDSATGQSLSGCIVYLLCTGGDGVGHTGELTSTNVALSPITFNGNTGVQFTTNGSTVRIEGLSSNSSYMFYEYSAPVNSTTGNPYNVATPQSCTFSTNANGDIVNVSASGDWSYSSGSATITLENGEQPKNPNFSTIGVLKIWPTNATNNFWQDTQFLSFAIQYRGDWATYEQYGWGDSFSYGRIRNPDRNAGQAYVGWLTTRESAIAYGGMSLYSGDNQWIEGRYYQHQNEAGQFVDNEGASYDWNHDLLYLPYGYYHITEYWQEAYISKEGQKEFAESANISGWTLEYGGPGTGSCQYGIIIKIDGNGTWICDSNGNPVSGMPISGGVRLESVSNDTRQASLDLRKIDLTGSGVDGISFGLFRNGAQIATGSVATSPSGTTTDSDGNTVNYYDVSWNYNYNQAWRGDDSIWHYTEHELTNEAVVQHLNYTTYQIREYITNIESYRVPDGWHGMDVNHDGIYEYFYMDVTLSAAYHLSTLTVDCGNSLNGRIDVTKVNVTGGPLTDLSFDILNSSNQVVATGYIPANATPETTGTGTATDYTYSATWDYTIGGNSFINRTEAVVGLGTFTVREFIPVSAFADRNDLVVSNDWTYGGVQTHNGVACYYFTKTIVIDDSNGDTVQDASITNEIHPTISTTLLDFDSRHITVVGENITFTDTVTYEGAYAGGSYEMHARLMEPIFDTDGNIIGAQLVTDRNGNYYENTVPFTASDTGSGTVAVSFTVNTAHLVEATQLANGVVQYSPRSVVCFESMTLVGSYEVANHNVPDSSEQTVEIPNPEIGTTFTDLQTFDHQVPTGRIVEVIDTCSYTNLHVDEEYTLTCFLYDQTTGDQLVYSNGDLVVGTATFRPQTESGTVNVTFTIDTSDLLVNVFAYEERPLVAFEYLRTENGILIGGHTDIDDLAQHNTIPTPPPPRSLLLDDQTGGHEGVIGAAVPMTDTVWYTNLNIGESYQIRGYIVDRDNPSIVYATQTVDFVPTTRDGTVDVHFVVDTSRVCEGNREAYICCFEEIWQLDTQNTGRGEVMLAREADPRDQDQSIHIVPECHTTMTDSVTQSNYGMIGENVELIDTVAYTNLHIGETYTVTGILMDKQTGEPITENGQPVTATTTFVAPTQDGTVEVVYHLNTLALIQQIGQTVNGITIEAPREVVSFETITSSSDYDFEIHADINDEGQTIILGDIRSGAGDVQTSTAWLASGLTTVRDTVHYRGLGPVEYTIRGSLHLVDYDENGQPIDGGLIQARPGEVTELEITFTPSFHEGDQVFDFKLDSNRFQGRNIVVFEELWYNGVCIISHENYSDTFGNFGMYNLDQTVHVASVWTSAFSFQSGEQLLAYDEHATVTDFVYCGNLELGQRYYCEASLWACYTDENGYIHQIPITQEDGGIACSKVFTATENHAIAEVAFTIDSTKLFNQHYDYLLVTERLIHAGSGVCIATHSDLTSKEQSINIPDLHTTFTSENGHTLPESAMSDVVPVTVTDRVYYENLICDGRSYTVVGNVQYARTDAQGNITESGPLMRNGQPVTSSVTFVPTEASGYIDVEFEVYVADIMAHGYNRIVAFEELYFGPEGIRVGIHADINDQDQTIDVPETPTPTPTPPETPPKTGDESGYATYVAGAIIAITFLAAGIALLAVLDRKNNPKKKE